MADVIPLNRNCTAQAVAAMVESNERYSAMHACARKQRSELISKAKETQRVGRWILALSGSPSFVAVMQSTDLRHCDNGSHFRRLNRS